MFQYLGVREDTEKWIKQYLENLRTWQQSKGIEQFLEVASTHDGQRLDEFVADHLELSRSQAQKIIKNGRVQMDGQVCRPKDIVKIGDEVCLVGESIELDHHFEPAPMDLDIVYEDYELIVLNKAAGIVVHPGAGTQERLL